MSATADTAQVMVRPPLMWALAAVIGIVLGWLAPWPFVPAAVSAVWVGTALVTLAVALFVWAIMTMTRAGSNVPTSRPTTTIVDAGPYGFTRNPIYVGMMLSLVGLAVAFDSIWSLITLIIFFLIIRFGVVAREEAYLDRKFGDVYRGYRSRVRRWL